MYIGSTDNYIIFHCVIQYILWMKSLHIKHKQTISKLTKSWNVSAVNISATLATTSKLCRKNCCHSVSLWRRKRSLTIIIFKIIVSKGRVSIRLIAVLHFSCRRVLDNEQNSYPKISVQWPFACNKRYSLFLSINVTSGHLCCDVIWCIEFIFQL